MCRNPCNCTKRHFLPAWTVQEKGGTAVRYTSAVTSGCDSVYAAITPYHIQVGHALMSTCLDTWRLTVKEKKKKKKRKQHHLTVLNLELLTDGVLFKLTRSIKRVMERAGMPFRLELNLDVAARYKRDLISVVNAHMAPLQVQRGVWFFQAVFAQLAAGRDVAFPQPFLHAFRSISKHLDAFHALYLPDTETSRIRNERNIAANQGRNVSTGMVWMEGGGLWRTGRGGWEKTLTTGLCRCYTNVNISFLIQSRENPIIKYLLGTGMFLSPVDSVRH